MSKSNTSKKKIHKTSDPSWNTHTYGAGKCPFDIDWIKHYNERLGKDQVIFLYSSKSTGEIVKYRVL